MVLGALLDWLRPLPLFSQLTARVLGGTLLTLGAALGLAAVQTLRRAGTNVRPDQPTLRLVTAGPYRWTRNPIYIAGLTVYLGVACVINGPAPFLLLLPLVALLRSGIVLREERYLTAKFGEPYRLYKARVRRWL